MILGIKLFFKIIGGLSLFAIASFFGFYDFLNSVNPVIGDHYYLIGIIFGIIFVRVTINGE